jgi:hypothetical protein
MNKMKKAKRLEVSFFFTGAFAVVTHSLHLQIMRVAAERRVVVVVVGQNGEINNTDDGKETA